MWEPTALAPEGPARPERRLLHRGVAWLARIPPLKRSAPVQDTVVLLPVGTIYHGTRKHHSIGEVLSV